MKTSFTRVVPILPAADVAASLEWWTAIVGFKEAFRHGDPVQYAGIHQGDVRIHIGMVSDPVLARTVGDQTMVRVSVTDIDAFYAEYQQRGGKVHPNGALEEKPWGGREFGALDPNGVCVSFSAEEAAATA